MFTPLKVLMLMAVVLAPAVPAPALVGVLEKPGQARVMFAFNGTTWEALGGAAAPEPPLAEAAERPWTLLRAGKPLGTLRLADPDPALKPGDWYRRDKVFQPLAGRALPAFRNQEGRFAGWMGTRDWRPMAIVTRRPCRQAEHWRPSRPGKDIKKLLLRPLVEAAGADNLIRCPSLDAGPVRLAVHASDLVIQECHRSSKGRHLVSISIPDRLYGCDGPVPPEWSRNWFLIQSGTIRYLGRNMELVEAGDFNCDGKTELLFWHSGYNEDGYLLMSNEFNNQTAFYWNYH